MADPLQSAIDAHRAGRLDEAAKLYRAVITRDPSKAHAHYLLGCLLMDRKDFPDADTSLRRAALLVPANPSYLSALATLHLRTGDAPGAIAILEKAALLKQSREEIFRNLGYALAGVARHADAVAAFRKGIDRFGTSAPLVRGYVESASQLGNPDLLMELVAILRKGDGANRELARQLEYRAASLSSNPEAALELARKWLEREPESTAATNAFAEALLARGEYWAAFTHCTKVLEKDPSNIEAILISFGALSKLEYHRESLAFGRMAIRALPDRKTICGSLSYALFKMSTTEGHHRDIEDACYYASIIHQLLPNDFNTNAAMSSVYLNMLRYREAMAHFDRARQIDPKNTVHISSRLFHDNYSWFYTREEVFERHMEWGRLVRERVGAPRTDFANTPDPDRPLRIGFVSGDFVYHPVAYFFLSVFSEILKTHEVCIYSNRKERDEDEMTVDFRREATIFRCVSGMKDEDFQAQVAADGVDVIFDLSGHTSDNRLMAFARRLAPVQVSWLGYPNTTGLDTMDFRLSDSIVEPENDAERFSAERIVRLPGGFHLYRPSYAIPTQVAPLPALKNNFITFGSFNNLKKASMDTYEAWAGILKAVPRSVIAIKDRNVDPRYTEDRVRSIMASFGVEPSRVTIKGMQKNNFDHMSAYNVIDVALDCFPYNGTTTTCEALVMGCPVVTVLGNSHVSRVSASLLTHVGHPEWIASTPEEYVRKAVELAADTAKLSEIRSNLREQLYASPVCDTARMERELTEAIRWMWRDWCARRTSSDKRSPATEPLTV